MPSFRYAGLDPIADGEGGIVRPGEIRDESDLPDFGPWEPVPDEPADEPEPPADVPAAPAPAKSTASKPAPASDTSATE